MPTVETWGMGLVAGPVAISSVVYLLENQPESRKISLREEQVEQHQFLGQAEVWFPLSNEVLRKPTREQSGICSYRNANRKPEKGLYSENRTAPDTVQEDIFAHLEKELIGTQHEQFPQTVQKHTRAETKKSAILQPKVELEAKRMFQKLQETRSQLDGLHLELKRKESNLNMLQTEKERLSNEFNLSEDSYLKEKQSLVEEIVQLKKMKEIMDMAISHKEMELLQSKQELERQVTKLKNNEHKVTVIKQQIERRSEQEKMTETQLGEKSLELLKVQSALHETEEKYYSKTATMLDKITCDFRDEIRHLRQQLREKEVMREHDRFLRNKIADDHATMTKENAVLCSQTLELNKQLERCVVGENAERGDGYLPYFQCNSTDHCKRPRGTTAL
ncbi:synaptonemal complex protein 1-like [Rhincodon typus]|uniref:synaptonemal complex protein 1-like n=1 Tax=Rhincodon typus TaxID=259920 RepID=UPI002030658F|nr:synaptonemal complex protein 1-like [Rhincodon typus]